MLADKTRYLAWVGWIKERGAPGCHGNSPRAALDPDRFLAIATGYESVSRQSEKLLFILVWMSLARCVEDLLMFCLQSKRKPQVK